MLISPMDGSLVWSNRYHQSGTLMPPGAVHPIIPGWSEGPNQESRDSGLDASHRRGMTSNGLLRRGACHRARVRATRWLLAMTVPNPTPLAMTVSSSLRRLPLPRRLARSRPLGCVSLAGCGRLLCGARSRRGGPPCRCLATARAADPAATLRGHVGVGNAAARAALVAAAGLLVDGCPSAPLGFLLADAAMLVSFLDVFG